MKIGRLQYVREREFFAGPPEDEGRGVRGGGGGAVPGGADAEGGGGAGEVGEITSFVEILGRF